MIPRRIEHGLHIPNSTRDRQDCVMLGHHDAVLAKSSVASESVVSASPELISVALRPVARTAIAIRDLLAGRFFDPWAWHKLLAVPFPFPQIELPEASDIFRPNT